MLKPELLEKRLKTEDVFNPKEKRIAFELQQTFSFSNFDLTHFLRDFYEKLAKAIFAGELRDRQTEPSIEPDLTDMRRNRYIEVKAAGYTRRVMLKDEQIRKYVNLQKSSPDSLRIYFVIFRYGTRGIQKKAGGFNPQQLVEYFSKDTKFMVGLPFSVVHEIHKQGYKGSLAKRCETERSTPCTNLTSPILDLFFAKPEQALKNFYLENDNFIIRKTRIAEGITINNYNLVPFPMTLIKDSQEYHDNWVKGLRQAEYQEVPF